ncbi:MAG: hypothetical protein AB7N76_24425 [Planctomycetota bacterium]
MRRHPPLAPRACPQPDRFASAPAARLRSRLGSGSRFLLAIALLCAGCASGPLTPLIGPKEVYVEPQGQQRVGMAPYPLDPGAEEMAYASIRSLSAGREDGRRRMAALLDQPQPQQSQRSVAAGSAAPVTSEVVIDASRHPGGLPELLFVPEKLSSERSSVVYVGHGAYRRETFRPGSDFAHHFRLLVVNHEAEPLQVRASSLRLALAQTGEDEGAVVASGYDLLAFANERGEEIQTLVVPPGGMVTGHAFFGARRMTPQLFFRFQVEDTRPPEGPGAGRRQRWPFQVRLARRYVIQEGRITPLERAVGRGETLPETTDPTYYTEPRVAPVGG